MIQLYENLAEIPPLDKRLWGIKSCTGCQLSPHLGKNPACKQVVVGDGNLDGRVLFVMMLPGATENEYGHAAIGITGGKLKNWLRQLDINPYEIGFWTNSLMCAFPPERARDRNKNKADQKELNACRKNLSLIIENMPNLKLVVCIGADALKAVIGKGTRLKDVTNNLMRFTWYPSNYGQEEKKLLAYALYHPSFIVRKDEGYAKEQAEATYLWSLKFLQQVILNIDDIEKLKPSGETIVCQSEEQAYEWAERQLRDNRINAYVVDFETLESNTWYSQAMCVAFAYFDPDKNCDVAFVVQFLQCLDLPRKEWFKRRRRKSLSRFEVKWKWADWYSAGFPQRFMDKLKPLFDINTHLPEGRERPMLGAYMASFDHNCWEGSFGWRPVMHLDQITQPDNDEVLPLDLLPALRLCGSQNSMKLENILKIVMPLVAEEKSIVNSILTKPQIDATGFGLLARKLPEQYKREDVILWAQEYKHFLGIQQQKRKKKVAKQVKQQCSLTPEQIQAVETYYSLDADGFLADILLDRAGFDARKELLLWKIVNDILSSPSENALFTFAREKSFDELFLGEQFFEAISQLNENDLVEQV